ncbi:hypothetical protein BKA70DRAFT_1224710 [Coprinopsis sp. MPI-PUGE-AT-0042]|nr:hypothetical protein BKA70DRAFT_1224710 [Coprinopsis sp. MPI-PUGE-AT-0042]
MTKPVEILHTILLGVVKYCWHTTHTPWKEPQKAEYTARLQASDIKGVSIPPIHTSYIMKYANSLIGRQFKILAQLNVFHIHDLVLDPQFELAKAIGVPEIRDLKDYLVDVDVAAANVLDAAAALDLSKLVTKLKYHLLAHLSGDIRRFGPLVGVASEGYESFNIIFRHCSILSNHLAPSRDITYQQAKQETFRHIASGGWWKDSGTAWKTLGSSLQGVLDGSKMLKNLFHLSQDKVFLAYNVFCAQLSNKFWLKGKCLITRSNDKCEMLTGRVAEILTAEDDNTCLLVVIKRFQISPSLHPKFGTPVLVRAFDETMKVVVSTRASKQERKDSGKTEKIIEHRSPERFVINTHGFHNLHLLWGVDGLRELMKPKLLYANRQQHAAPHYIRRIASLIKGSCDGSFKRRSPC